MKEGRERRQERNGGGIRSVRIKKGKRIEGRDGKEEMEGIERTGKEEKKGQRE